MKFRFRVGVGKKIYVCKIFDDEKTVCVCDFAISRSEAKI